MAGENWAGALVKPQENKITDAYKVVDDTPAPKTQSPKPPANWDNKTHEYSNAPYHLARKEEK